MGKKTIAHICGHTAEARLYGKSSERENRVTWLEGQLCPECEREQSTKAIAHLALPELAGTARQVRWAEDIRARFFAYRANPDENALRGYYGITDAIPYLDRLRATTEAKWWIENREDPLGQIIKEIQKGVIRFFCDEAIAVARNEPFNLEVETSEAFDLLSHYISRTKASEPINATALEASIRAKIEDPLAEHGHMSHRLQAAIQANIRKLLSPTITENKYDTEDRIAPPDIDDIVPGKDKTRPRWLHCFIDDGCIAASINRSVCIKMPRGGSYAGYSLWVPAKLLRDTCISTIKELSARNDFIFSLKKYAARQRGCDSKRVVLDEIAIDAATVFSSLEAAIGTYGGHTEND